MANTARALVEQARIRHWSFIDVQLGDGAAVLWLNQRQRHLLLRNREALRGLLGGIDRQLATTDTLTNGWPLPTDAIAVYSVGAEYADGTVHPITVGTDESRLERPPNRWPMAYLSGGKIIPVSDTAPATTIPGRWASVVAVQIAYLAPVTIATLDDTLALPAVLTEALIAGLAKLFAQQSPTCTATERAQFVADAKSADAEIDTAAREITGEVQVNHVRFR